MSTIIPFFSIIVPCCDVEPYVRECLDSVLNQPFTDWECLIGVETSKDRTEEIVREYERKDARFKVFTGPRSGSCSASRNTGIDMAIGEYIIFLDGDDTIAEGSLQRLHEKIAARPGADLYPCAVKVHNDINGKEEGQRDNYPLNVIEELSGPDATLLISQYMRHPEPMMQLTVYRRVFLLDCNLKCLYGLSGQDREFTPRALYLAKRVLPLHEPYYLYRKRNGSVMTTIGYERLLHDQAVIHKSLFAFHASASRQLGFDCKLSSCWARSWISWIIFIWFSPNHVKRISRNVRADRLQQLFANGFDDFNMLLKSTSTAQKMAAWWLKVFVRFPALRLLSELFFNIYFFLSKTKK